MALPTRNGPSVEPGVRVRAEYLYQQLDSLQPLPTSARRTAAGELPTEPLLGRLQPNRYQTRFSRRQLLTVLLPFRIQLCHHGRLRDGERPVS